MKRSISDAETLGASPDRQLTCVPIGSSEGRDYLGAMRAAANYAWSTRQVILHLLRAAFRKVWDDSVRLDVIHDVCHNIAKRVSPGRSPGCAQWELLRVRDLLPVDDHTHAVSCVLEGIAVIERQVGVFPDLDRAHPFFDPEYPGRVDSNAR